MIHAAIYEGMSHSEREAAYENAPYILWMIFPLPQHNNADMLARWKISNIYFPHLLRNWDRGQDSGLTLSHTGATLLRNGAQWVKCISPKYYILILYLYRYAFETGNFRKAASLFAAAREACESAPGAEVPPEIGLLLADILHFEAWK